MTQERRLVLSLDEIKVIRWECAACHTVVSYGLGQDIVAPERCPNCATLWAPLQPRGVQAPINQFLTALRQLMPPGAQDPQPPYQIKIEIERQD
jgi:hypothetical protein